MDDPEYAGWVLSLPEQPSRGPRMSEWTPDVARLTDIYDRLGELVAAVIATAGGKPPKLVPSRRPRTELDRLRDRSAQARHAGLVAEVKAAQARYEAAREVRDDPEVSWPLP